MSKIIMPKSDLTLGNDPDVDIEVQVSIRLKWKNRIVQPHVESLRTQLQQAFNEESRKIEKDLRDIVKRKKSPGFNSDQADG